MFYTQEEIYERQCAEIILAEALEAESEALAALNCQRQNND